MINSELHSSDHDFRRSAVSAEQTFGVKCRKLQHFVVVAMLRLGAVVNQQERTAVYLLRQVLNWLFILLIF